MLYTIVWPVKIDVTKGSLIPYYGFHFNITLTSASILLGIPYLNLFQSFLIHTTSRVNVPPVSNYPKTSNNAHHQIISHTSFCQVLPQRKTTFFSFSGNDHIFRQKMVNLCLSQIFPTLVEGYFFHVKVFHWY